MPPKTQKRAPPPPASAEQEPKTESSKKRKTKQEEKPTTKPSEGIFYATNLYNKNEANWSDALDSVDDFGLHYFQTLKTHNKKSSIKTEAKNHLAHNTTLLVSHMPSLTVHNRVVSFEELFPILIRDGTVGDDAKSGSRRSKKHVPTTICSFTNSAQRQLVGDGHFASSYITTLVCQPDVSANITEPVNFINILGQHRVCDVVQDCSVFTPEELNKKVDFTSIFTGESMIDPNTSSVNLRLTNGFHRTCVILLYLTGALPLPPELIEYFFTEEECPYKGRAVFARPPVRLDDETESMFLIPSITQVLDSKASCADKLSEMIASMSGSNQKLRLVDTKGNPCLFSIERASALFSPTSTQLPKVYLKPHLHNKLVRACKLRIVVSEASDQEQARQVNDVSYGVSVRNETNNHSLFSILGQTPLGKGILSLDGDVLEYVRGVLFRGEGLRASNNDFDADVSFFEETGTPYPGVTTSQVEIASFDAVLVSVIGMVYLLSQRPDLANSFPEEEKPERVLANSNIITISGTNGLNITCNGFRLALHKAKCSKADAQEFVKALLSAFAFNPEFLKGKVIGLDLFTGVLAWCIKSKRAIRAEQTIQQILVAATTSTKEKSQLELKEDFMGIAGLCEKDIDPLHAMMLKQAKKYSSGAWMRLCEDVVTSIEQGGSHRRQTAIKSLNTSQSESQTKCLATTLMLLNTERTTKPRRNYAEEWTTQTSLVWEAVPQKSTAAVAEVVDSLIKLPIKNQFTVEMEYLKGLVNFATEMSAEKEDDDEHTAADIITAFYLSSFGKGTSNQKLTDIFNSAVEDAGCILLKNAADVVSALNKFNDLAKDLSRKELSINKSTDLKRKVSSTFGEATPMATTSCGRHVPTQFPAGKIPKKIRLQQKQLEEARMNQETINFESNHDEIMTLID